MTDSPSQRWLTLTWALVCLGLFAAIAVLVGNHWSPLLDLDQRIGRWTHDLSYNHPSSQPWWIWLGRFTGSISMTVVTLVAASALFAKNYRRAALWVLIVMVIGTITFRVLKVLTARDRPEWVHPIQTLKGYSFPSGHATSISAAIGIVIVLALMLIRRRSLRRLLIVTAVLFAFLVAADRLFLGVHHFSDVIAGLLLGTAISLLALIAFDPRPRSIAEQSKALSPPVRPTDRRLAVILNPVKVDDPVGFKAMVEKMAIESGWSQTQWWETTVEDTGYAMAHEAAVNGAELAIAIGGDGTVRAVCEELAGTGIPVGIVPAGTGNLLARNLGLPLYLRAAVDVALNGQDRAIDMVRVAGDEMEDATFLVMAGMGFDAAIMEGVNETFKSKVGWLAYVWSGLKSLMFPAIRVEVSVDGGEFTSHRARTIVIGNVGHLQAGMPLLPDAAIDDGQLDVVLLYPRRFLSWLPIAARVLTKNPRTDERIARMTGQRVVVRTSSAAPRQLDGDLIAPGKEVRAECVHGRLLVRVPR